jgi:hypothetical protein
MEIFGGLPIDLARPDGEATFTRLPQASTRYYALCRLLRASVVQKYRVGIRIRRTLVSQYFGVNNIQVVQKQMGAGLQSCWEDSDSLGIC